MNKNINNIDEISADPESALSSSVWLKENEALIEKLEAAYQAAPDKSEVSHENQFYGIKFSSLNLLIDNTASSELLEDSSIYSIPLAAEWIIGVVNIRGDIVPVIDFEKLINGESTNNKIKDSKIIVINKGEDAVGFLLEYLPRPISFTENEKLSDHTSLPEVVEEHVVHAYKRDTSTWACIDFESFLQSIKC